MANESRQRLLGKTKDFAILETQIPYTDHETFLKTSQTASLYDHLQKEIAYIEANFLKVRIFHVMGMGTGMIPCSQTIAN